MTLLEKFAYSVASAESGEKALELLVLDMIMPEGVGGRETYKRALQIHPRQKATLVTGYDESR